MHRKQQWLMLGLITCIFTGCASNAPPTSYPYSPNTQSNNDGTIESITWVGQEGNSRTTGAATLVGGILGAIIGNQVGGGTGRALATVAGGVGGAVIGNRMENQHSQNYYQIKIRMDHGGHHLVNQTELGNLRTGDRIRIINEQAYQL